MNNNFRAFLEENISDIDFELWDDSVIENVKVNKQNKKWTVFVKTKTLVKCDLLEISEKKLLKKFSFLDSVEINQSPLNIEHDINQIISTHKDELSSYLFSDKNNDFNSISWHISCNRVDMIVSDQSFYVKILEKNIATKLYKWFLHQYRLRIIVRVIVDVEIKAKLSLDAFISSNPINIIEESKISSENNKKKNYKRNKKQLEVESINGDSVNVCELVEGLKVAITEGEVWKKEVTILKDGRIIVAYYLTDYTDTIVVKNFYDSFEEDVISKDDWIKVKGSIRYDPFLKEIALFLECFSRGDKPLRVDEVNQKRIELHAHTKMSMMDGLAPVDDLIKKAAQWGHSAIAITDHGCTQAFPDAYESSKKYNIKVIYGVEGYLIDTDKKERPYHIILLVRNYVGLKNLYKIVSSSYLDNYYRFPKIPRSIINEYREGLIIGSACDSGELYSAILNGESEENIIKIANYYDYLEIQPLKNNEFLLRKGNVSSWDELQDINKKIYNIGKKLNKLVVATGDVHFLEPRDEIMREIIQFGQGYEDSDQQAPLFFKTTKEMLDDFSYLGDEISKEVVIYNPNNIAELIEDIKPVPDGFYPPKIDTAEQEIVELTYSRAKEIYSDKLPEIVDSRVKKEINSITTHGFSVLYLISHKLVKKSNDDGYLVGSRGSVGSSLVAFFTGITEVNPLEPHYLCRSCKYSLFITDGAVGCGADLPNKECPNCGNVLDKDGFDIPFETFLGFEGDKVPDIDLNFSGDYQSRAHQYVEELFGKENVFRAGTISTIADKTAFGFVKKYFEEKQIDKKNSEIIRLAQGITGVRRTTGQHPGGLIVVPKDRDVFEFTPLQHPADNKDSGIITTHFEYHAIGDQLVKLDILGHDDPTVIKELEDLTGVKALSISLSEEKTMQIFSSVEPLGIKPEDIDTTVGTYGIPELGTKFVRQMLEATRPTTFSELVKISGLSHGTDVWLNNAQDLIKSKTATLNEVICTRDDIMIYLIHKGMDKKQAFKIMENVRKGKGVNQEEKEIMLKCDVPQWYIESCDKIKYMFPKAHAVAYVTMAFRIAFFKVYYPLEFYASFFSIRAEDFDSETILMGYEAVKRRISEIDLLGYKATPKDKKLATILELAMEMYARGYKFHPIDIYISDAKKFIVKDKGLLLPFSSLPNVGFSAAYGICEARKNGEFLSVEEFQQRTKLNKTAMEILRKNDCFNGLPEKNQISLFG